MSVKVLYDTLTPDRRYLLIVTHDTGDNSMLRSILDRSTGRYLGYVVGVPFDPSPDMVERKARQFINAAKRERLTATSEDSYIKRGRIWSKGIIHLFDSDYVQPGTRDDMPEHLAELWAGIETNYRVRRDDERAGYRSGWMQGVAA